MDPNELRNRNLTLLKTVPSLAFSCSCVWNETAFGGRDQQILSSLVGRIGQRTVPTAWCDCSRNIFAFGNYYAAGAWSEEYFERFLVYTRTILHALLWEHYYIWQSFIYLDSFIFVYQKKDLVRQMATMTTCQKWELYLTCSLIHILNIAAHLNI